MTVGNKNYETYRCNTKAMRRIICIKTLVAESEKFVR